MKQMIIALILLSLSGPISAHRLNSPTSSVNVNLTVKDGVATLYGNVDSQFESVQAGKEAAKIEGVHKVRNLLFYSN